MVETVPALLLSSLAAEHREPKTSPTITETTPTAAPIRGPIGKTFSARTTSASAADPNEIHHAEHKQQRHERRATTRKQVIPCKRPSRAAPARPGRQNRIRNDIGERQGVEARSLQRRGPDREAGGDQKRAANVLDFAERERVISDTAPGPHEKPLGDGRQRRRIRPRRPNTWRRKSWMLARKTAPFARAPRASPL